MEMPKYHLRIVSDSEAHVFRVGLNDQRRIKWERCAAISVLSGEISMQDGASKPTDLQSFCNAGLATFSKVKLENPDAYSALIAMGKMAKSVNTLESPMDSALFELMVWTEADLKNGLVANKGLALLEDSDQEKHILQGQHYMSEGNFAAAEVEYKIALQKRKNLANINNFLAMSLSKQGKLEEAATAIDASVSKNPNNAGFILRGAQYNLAARKLEKAQGYIAQLTKTPTLSTDQKLQTSRLAMRANLKDAGLVLVQQLVENGEGGEPALEHYVNSSVAISGEKAVFEIMQKHVHETPLAPRLKEWYIRTLIHYGNLEKAEKVARGWIAEDQNSVQGHFQLGRAHMAKNKPRSALRSLTKAAELAPENAPIFKLIADAYIGQNDLAGAAAASEQACTLAPDNKNFLAQSKRITSMLMKKPSSTPR